MYGLSKISSRPAQRQSTPIAIGLAVLVAIAGAVLWGLVAMQFHRQLSLLGLLIGGGVGYVVARYRSGHLPTIVAGAVIAVLGCALGTLLGIVFTLMHYDAVPLSLILGHLSTLFHGYPSAVGVLGLFFWAIAALAAVRLPLQSQRAAARRSGYRQPGFGQPGYGTSVDGLPGYGQPRYGAAPDGGSAPADGGDPAAR